MERCSKQNSTMRQNHGEKEYFAKGQDDSGRKFAIDKTFTAATNQKSGRLALGLKE